jgi:hypothetical protein
MEVVHSVVHTFRVFAQRTRADYLGPDSVVVDVCLHAMEEGILSAIATERGHHFLWEYYILTTDQLARTCALLQRHRLPSSLLWTLQTRLHCTLHALTRIEFLWQDLDAVDVWVHFMRHRYCDVEWVAAEVARRRQWFTGLRRAWLLATSG